MNSALPIYTVLVPLFRETKVVPGLLKALKAIDYPESKLDIKILLEESDVAMVETFSRISLPKCFEVLTVPRGKPQTKPRALNYGLQFARGDYLVIYDAEDVPDPQQLRLAADMWSRVGSHVGCLQAQLTYFNSKENWLTRQFTAEYSILFDGILPVLSDAGLPILLGGTSNHFRVQQLIDVGGWDPFNVTEDADLGLRLARQGLSTRWLNSSTHEEAVNSLEGWTKQRSRWLKGFLQTWLVHMRQPILSMRELGFTGFWLMQCMTLGVFLTALLHPFLIGFAVGAIALTFVNSTSSLPSGLLLLGAIVFVLGYASSAILAVRTLRHRFGKVDWYCILTMPAYWFIAQPAAALALYDLVVRPHHWRKTQHGVSAILANQK